MVARGLGPRTSGRVSERMLRTPYLGRTLSDSWIWLPAGAMVGIEFESNIFLLVSENMLCSGFAFGQ